MSRNSAKWRLLQAMLLTVFLVVLKLIDPFGLSSAGDDASAGWLNRMFSGYYPDTGQQHVVVIEIDDDYLLRNNTYWPLPYDEQSKLFKRLLAFRPQSVFVDLMYSHEHPVEGQPQGSQLLANVFERYERAGIGLYLANTGKVRGEKGQINTLANLAQVTRPAQVFWDGIGSKYPLAMTTPSGTTDTPAMALYREYCRTNRCPGLPVDAESAAGQPAMAIQWGITLSKDQALVGHTSPCKNPNELDQTVRAPLGNVWLQIKRGLLWKQQTAQSNGLAPCRYSLTLPASALEVTDPLDYELVKSLLQGRQVLVGASITSSGDFEQSPVNGQVPGVFLHAMALDNLITYGMGYDREPDGFWLNITWLDLLEVALGGVVFFIKSWIKKTTDREVTRGVGYRIRASVMLPVLGWLSVVTLIALLSWGLKAAHITPLNVLTILSISLLLLSDVIGAIFKVASSYFSRHSEKGNHGC